MRTYIFTAHEREVIRAFLAGEIPSTGKAIGQIRWRMDSFEDLCGDVDLYRDLQIRLAKTNSAVST